MHQERLESANVENAVKGRRALSGQWALKLLGIQRAMDDLGIARSDIDRAEDMYRARDKERLRIQIETGDLRAARARVAAEQPWGDGPTT